MAWLDLANAYGSVHHSLIQFSLKHYHAPPQLTSIVGSLYCGLSATVLTQDWSTPTFPLQVGVYQGDPFSVVVFNSVINTLMDTLRPDLSLATIYITLPTALTPSNMQMIPAWWPTAQLHVSIYYRLLNCGWSGLK